MKKTIKIPEELHKDLRKLQAHWGVKTLPETIRGLWCFYTERMKETNNDQSKK